MVPASLGRPVAAEIVDKRAFLKHERISVAINLATVRHHSLHKVTSTTTTPCSLLTASATPDAVATDNPAATYTAPAPVDAYVTHTTSAQQLPDAGATGASAVGAVDALVFPILESASGKVVDISRKRLLEQGVNDSGDVPAPQAVVQPACVPSSS